MPDTFGVCDVAAIRDTKTRQGVHSSDNDALA